MAEHVGHVQVACPICLSRDGFECRSWNDEVGNLQFDCDVCGRFGTSHEALEDQLQRENGVLPAHMRSLLSHRIRRQNEANASPPLILTYTIDELINSGNRSPRPSQQASNLVRFVGEHILSTGDYLPFMPPGLGAIIGAPTRALAIDLAFELESRGILNGTPLRDLGPQDFYDVGLTLAGWELFEAEQRGEIKGNYGFMALKFGDETLDPFLTNVIKPAVQSLGYELVDMRDVAKTGIIDNLMREQIRDAAFVLVDLTHANSGAYWEAGYAEGLGKPVLYICEQGVFEVAGTHFDTNHCTTVTWSKTDAEQFSKNLIATLRRSLGLFG